MLHTIAHPANIQDRDGGILVMSALFGMVTFLETLFADGGYQGPQFAKSIAKVLQHLDAEIVKRSDRVGGFVPFPIAGLSNAPSLDDAEDSPNIGRTSTARRSCSCASPQSASA